MKYTKTVYIRGLGTKTAGDEVKEGDKEHFQTNFPKADWQRYTDDESDPKPKQEAKKATKTSKKKVDKPADE